MQVMDQWHSVLFVNRICYLGLIIIEMRKRKGMKWKRKKSRITEDSYFINDSSSCIQNHKNKIFVIRMDLIWFAVTSVRQIMLSFDAQYSVYVEQVMPTQAGDSGLNNDNK